MLSLCYLLIFLACGVFIIRMLLPGKALIDRIWLGLSLGLLLLMWLPALCAFAMDFSRAAHYTALLPLAALTAGSWFVRDRREVKRWDRDQRSELIRIAAVVVPLTILGGYLQYTHNMRVDEWGNYNVGQSTYGDLPMHLSFITGLINSPFPADYPFCPGVQLSYPFLTDSLSSSMLLFGWSLQASVIIPGTLMMALCYTGVMVLARDLTVGKKAVILASLLFFLNGGLGFLYDFDLAGGTEYDGTLTVWSRIEAILTGYYTTPTNQPEPNNLRWSNVIADLMIPQRTLLGGWCMVLPCFYLLFSVFKTDSGTKDHRIACETSLPVFAETRSLVLLGVWSGALPLIHTHSFLALGLCTAGIMVYDLIHGTGRRKALLCRYLVYAAIAVAFAAPQLILFTFRQALSGGGGNSFLSLHFNWVNNSADEGLQLKDLYFWFYIKNIGLPFIALILALFERDPHNRRLFAGALPIILAVEFIRFQPNIYDNNKLLYLAWLLCCMIVANWCASLWHRLKGMRSRPLIAAAAAVCVFLSAGLTLWRECVSDYQAFSSSAVEAADWVKANTEEHSVFMSGTQHLNPVSSLAGRTTVCGPDLWLYYHGIDTTDRKRDLSAFYTDPDANSSVLIKYNVDYIMVSSYERSSYDVDEEALRQAYEVVFSNWEMTIYKVPEG